MQASDTVIKWCMEPPVVGGAAWLLPAVVLRAVLLLLATWLAVPSILGVVMSAKGSSVRAESAVKPWPEGLLWRVSRAAGGYSQGLTLWMKGSGLRAKMASQSTW